MWKHFISDYLSFTKKDRTGILVLLFLTGVLIILPFLYPYFIKQKTYDVASFETAIASLKLKQADSSGKVSKRNFDSRVNQNNDRRTGNNYYSVEAKGELFYFDPNSASPSDWRRLGVRDKTIATIQNYLAKGGKFSRKEDIGKIWGLHKDEVQRLIPYVQIKNTGSASGGTANTVEKQEYKRITNAPSVVDINTADTTAFIALPGIGSKLSQRIINFREKLGGFYKVAQIGETFGLADSTFQKIKGFLVISYTELRQININTATIDQLKSHPYIRYVIANAIVQYRSQHGNFTAVDDIKKIMLITEDVFNKLAPYIVVN